jgi:hypothetical protein
MKLIPEQVDAVFVERGLAISQFSKRTSDKLEENAIDSIVT